VIYLIVQMIVALVLAAICGGAIGWLVHRASQTRYTDNLRRSLARQQNQLVQTQSEINMLTDDYEDLQRRSQDEIDALREQTEQIPILNTNLESSQLMVRQMLQKHESRVRNLDVENQSLTARLKKIEERDQTSNTVKAELDKVRRNNQTTAAHGEDASIEANVVVPDYDASAHPLNADDGVTHPANEYSPNNDTSATLQQTDANDQLRLTESEMSAGDVESDLSDDVKLDDNTPGTSAQDQEHSVDYSAAPSRDADSTTVADKRVASERSAAATRDARISDARSSGSWASAAVSAVSSNSTTINLNADSDAPESGDPFDNVMEVGDELQRELDSDTEDELLLDGSHDASNLFDPVEQHDDLKQIFGIGPVTEKALNELGITSYSQLADLKDHDIDQIASALEIVPGRIERDDWVGNARRQLEDVLEQL